MFFFCFVKYIYYWQIILLTEHKVITKHNFLITFLYNHVLRFAARASVLGKKRVSFSKFRGRVNNSVRQISSF